MIKAIKILKLIETISSRKEKEKILKDNESQELKFLLVTALNPYLIYGVKKLNPTINDVPIPLYHQLRLIREKLVQRELTGNIAKTDLEALISCKDKLVVDILTRVFKKDLRIGIDVKTVNKVFLNIIPTFEIGLCSEYDEETKTLPVGKWVMEPKLDGLRCVTIIDEHGFISFHSRNGKILYNLEYIEAELKKLNFKEVVFDGELFAGDWNESISITHTQNTHKRKKELIYQIFDMVNLQEWRSRQTKSYSVRKNVLFQVFYGLESKYIQLVKPYSVKEFSFAQGLFKQYLEQGYEGGVLKEIDSQYPFKRSKNWLKWKPFYTYDIEIIDYEEGKGKHIGKLGAFICNYQNKVVNVGSGLSDEQREQFWINRVEMVGKIVEVKSQGVTKDGSLRFPIFIRLRKDKS